MLWIVKLICPQIRKLFQVWCQDFTLERIGNNSNLQCPCQICSSNAFCSLWNYFGRLWILDRRNQILKMGLRSHMLSLLLSLSFSAISSCHCNGVKEWWTEVFETMSHIHHPLFRLFVRYLDRSTKATNAARFQGF